MKFAHFSDIHLGFQKKEVLQRVEQDVFERALDDCIKRSVDFILICGDMFHVNIPEMRVQKFAFAKLRQIHDAGIPVYVVYGSHDFSPHSTSVIDLLVETGYITKVQHSVNNDDGSLSLDFITDDKTGVKLTGIAGLALSKDISYYERLNLNKLESESGFKIFLFHGAISEMRTADDISATAEAAMPISYMPKNFDYYAGGHIHKYQYQQFENHHKVVYPGTLFAGFHSDLEDNAHKNIKRGYVLVEFDDDHGVTDVKQIQITNCQYELVQIDASHKSSDVVNAEITKNIDSINPENKVVILNIKGKLSEGKTTDIAFTDTTHDLMNNGALEVEIKRNQLTSAEYDIVESKGDTADEIATNTFAENIGQVDSVFDELMGEKGAELAKSLLAVLSKPSLENESLNVYQKRITDEAMSTLGLLEKDEKYNRTKEEEEEEQKHT